jgi:Zn-dependent M28 family amino/carboxypeptidase
MPRPILSALLALALPIIAAPASCGQGVPATPPHVRLDAAERSLLMSDLAWLADDARGGRRAGSAEGAAVRAWLVERFAAAGFEAVELTFDLGDGLEGANVVATVLGTGEGEAVIVVTAHFDHLGTRNGTVYNGADDNASGTAALLALAAELATSPPSNTVMLVALDAEESGLRGAHAFVADPPIPLERILLNVNLDMVGRSEAGELYAAGTSHYPELRPPLEAVAGIAPVILRFGHDKESLGRDDWTFQSDHAAFHRAGIPFVYFGVEDHEDYHRPTDDTERIDADFYARAVDTIILAVEGLDRHLAPTRKID